MIFSIVTDSMLEITSFFKVSYVWLSTVPIFLPTGQKGDGVPCILIIFSMAAGSTAWQIRYSEISESGTARVAPPVPDFTSMIPSFFKALKIFRMVTGLHPVDNDSSSLVTFFYVPYSKIKIRQWTAIEHLLLICIISILHLQFYHIPFPL